MRVTGGSARGIPLRVPAKGGVRPATDYIREAVFNSLAAFVPGTHVLDLFAGTGAYGLESLSRGAASATCVDLHAGADLQANAASAARRAERKVMVRTLKGRCLIVAGKGDWPDPLRGPTT